MSIFRGLKRALRSVDEYVALVVSVIRDGVLTQQELMQLHSMAAKLDMTLEEREKAHLRAVESLMSEFMSDGYLDDRELRIFESAAQSLRIDPNLINPNVGSAIAHMVQLQRIAGGQLPVISPNQTPLVLAQGEVAHISTPCKIVQEKTVARRYVGGYSGVSVRIARGVRYHVGASRGVSVPVTAAVTVSQGVLVITNQRVVYLGSTKGFNKPWLKVSAVEPFNNAVTFHFSDRQNATTLMYENQHVAPYVEGVCSNILA